MLTHHHQILLRCQPDMNLPISLLHLIPCIKEHRTHDTLQWSTIPNTKRRRTLLHRVAVQHHHSHIYSILFLNFWITVLVGALVQVSYYYDQDLLLVDTREHIVYPKQQYTVVATADWQIHSISSSLVLDKTTGIGTLCGKQYSLLLYLHLTIIQARH